MPADLSARGARPAPAASTLAIRYSVVLAGYLAVVWALWQVGVEAIYGHPTPFYALFRPVLEQFGLGEQLLTQALVAIVVGGFFALFVWATGRVRWYEETLGPRAERWFVFGTIAFAFAFAGSVAMLRGGLDGIAQGYERPYLEYMHDIGTGGSIGGLFAEYTRVHEHLTAHSRVHPPGPIALLWLFSYVVGRDALPLAIATMAFGVVGLVPLFYWVKAMLGQRVALTAIAVYATVPSIVLFTATSADIAFTPFTLATLWLFWRALERRSYASAAIAGVGYALMSLLSFTLLSLGAFFALEGLRRLVAHGAWRAVVQTAAIMIATFLAAHLAVRIATGFDYLAAFDLAMASFQHDQAMLNEFAPRYSTWWFKLINPASWFFFAGIPVSVLFVHRLWRPEPKTKRLFIVFALTLLALDILYMARGEGERSAMYVFPFVVIPAAHLLDEWGGASRSRSPLFVTLGFLVFQCWLVEVLFYTYW